jgi:hypothetical protein
MSKQRHKWVRLGHKYHHQKECVKCGCIKDQRAMLSTHYKLNGQIFYLSPECKPATQ